MKNNDIKTCVICKNSYIGYGNNAWPITTGLCCDTCNFKIVIPARLHTSMQGEESND